MRADATKVIHASRRYRAAREEWAARSPVCSILIASSFSSFPIKRFTSCFEQRDAFEAVAVDCEQTSNASSLAGHYWCLHTDDL